MRRVRLDRQTAVIGALTAMSGALQLALWSWEVEDAAISFAYARNLAAGDGLVAQVGAERVEGFSNPLWVAILAVGSALGIDPFPASRWLGLILGCATVPMVARALRPLEDELPLAPVCGAAAVALFAPHVVWSQSGLENPLFSFLLAAGCARLAIGGDREWIGPLAFLGLAWTRPDGAGYAAIAALVAIASSRSWAGARIRAATWTLVFGIPLLASEAARLWYFGQELPATAYAKLGRGPVLWLDARSRGWRQLRDLAGDTGAGLLLPLMTVGASGARGGRWVTGAIAAAAVLAAWSAPSSLPIAIFLALPLLSVGRRLPIGLAASMLLLAVLFHVRTDGDWMRGYRWMSLAAVPGAMLAGVGAAELARRASGLRILVLSAAALLAVPQVACVIAYQREPEVSPRHIQRRLEHWIRVGRKLGLDRTLRIVDHDMGGNLFYGGELASFRDTAGLVDLPFALYGKDPGVVQHELFEDRRFDFVHAHASSQVAVGRNPTFRREYVEIEPYGSGHRGQFVRRSLLLEPQWTGPSIPISFQGGIEVRGFSVPSPEVASGSGLYLEVGIAGRSAPFRLIGFVIGPGGVAQSWDLPPTHDWLPPGRWKGEVFHGRFTLTVPEGLPEGDYALGLVALDSDGRVLPALSAASPATIPETPVFAAGEVRLPSALRIIGRDEMNALARARVDQALAEAGAGRCEAAEAAWERGLRHRIKSRDWRSRHRPAVARAIASCLARRAASGPLEGQALLDRVRELEAARAWDPREEAVWSYAEGVASEAHARALAAGTPTERFRWAEAAVRADPRRSWDRRLAERARSTWVRRSGDPEEGDGPER